MPAHGRATAHNRPSAPGWTPAAAPPTSTPSWVPAPAPPTPTAAPGWTPAADSGRLGHRLGQLPAPSGPPIQRFSLTEAKNKNAFTKQNGESDANFKARMRTEMAALRTTMDATNTGAQAYAKGDLTALPVNFYAQQRNARDAELANIRKAKTVAAVKAGGIEARLNNPVKDPTVVDREQVGMVKRQQEVMRVAKLADPFMRALETGPNLHASHRMRADMVNKKGQLAPGYQFAGGNVTETATGRTMHAVGAKEYGNRATRGKELGGGAVEQLLPQLTNPSAAVGVGTDSRVGRWSEADVSPLTQAAPGAKKVGQRDADRLLHTAPASMQEDATGGTSPVYSRYWVTSDHYKSAVPVSPLPAARYRNANENSSPYRDPSGKMSSLQYHDFQQRELAARDAAASSQRREAAEEARGQAQEQTRARNEDLARTKAAHAAGLASQRREAVEAERTRVEEEARAAQARRDLEDAKYGNSGL